jgi:hypothetical protein
MCSVDGLARRMPAMTEALQSQDRELASLTVAPRVDVTDLPDVGAVDAWRQAGADELVVGVSSPDLADHRAGLAHLAKLAQAAAS